MQSASENGMSNLAAENATQKYPIIPHWEVENYLRKLSDNEWDNYKARKFLKLKKKVR